MSHRRKEKDFNKLLRTAAAALPVTYYEVNSPEYVKLYPVNHTARIQEIFEESNGDMQRIENYINEVETLAKSDLQVPIYNPFPFLYNQPFN